MAEETITILKVGTDEAVKNINDLKNNVKELKDRLGDLEIGTEEYQDTLEELKVNQAAMKDAMYATSSSMEDLAKSATGTSESYNSLVHRMAALKEELRATDVSTKQGKERFQELAGQVNAVNDQLKEMDALQGNFQRNVGNYKSAFDGIKDSADALGKALGVAGKGINGVKDSADALGKSPMLATFGILVSLGVKLAETLKDNDNAMASIKKGMEALKPVMNFISGVIDTLAVYLADIIDKVSTFVTSNGLLDKIINGVMGVGNAIVQFVIAPFKAVIAAVKVFQEEGIKGFRNATKAFGEEMKNGVSFKHNYQAGVEMVNAVAAGAKSQVKTAGKEVREEMQKEAELSVDAMKKLMEQHLKEQDALIREREREQKELDALTAESLADTNAQLEAYFEEERLMREKDLKDAQEHAKQKVLAMQSVVSATSSILSSMAALYEADAEASEKNAIKVKALRIASATIDTISGAIGAFMQATKTYTPPLGQIIGSAQAAAITAAGMAQIAQMKSVQMQGGTASIAPMTSPSVGAVTQAPTFSTSIPQFAQLTGASGVDNIKNPMKQKVYILSSDIERSLGDNKTKVTESSF